ncbi:glycosyltransferase family 2 protein [Algoriphagus formosus]|uniref:Glycosyltransferase family 2 protein n=1 Tax=Algoriphagus formosus TaxID=2007308 RepID=A0A4R5USG0_9BACT|nr:glycosyltransferase [Algoriphagus aquimaris]TDK42042.1 glycosyltransferase family 2 protein [Algoriphagus aquimaris]
MKKVAVLITCHNRKEKTLLCLDRLFKSIEIFKIYLFEIFLVDDGSTDGTGLAVGVKFPIVSIIKGNGNLFWNQGMRLAWQIASETRDFDFYLWLNDDSYLDQDGLIKIFDAYRQALIEEQSDVIITAACRSEEGISTFSYGGRSELGPVIPNGKIQKCTYINGNIVLVPKVIFKKIGILSSDYLHGIGDFDYGLRAANAGFKCYTTKDFVATCKLNDKASEWFNPDVPIKIRWKLMHSPLGLNIKDYTKYRKRFWPRQWMFDVLKAYVKMIFPRLYSKL